MRELAATTWHDADFSRPAPTPVAGQVVGRIPRVARLLAFAHHLDAQIREGAYDDMADAARKLGLSRARLTQVMGLVLLAPSIQEEILGLPPVTTGRDRITERTLRPLIARSNWTIQLAMWRTECGK